MKRRDLFMSFIEEWQDKESVWGVSDCSAWPALWVEVATGQKVPLPAYETRGEAARLIAKAGGLVALWRAALAETRAYEIDIEDVSCGDVGILDMSDCQRGVIFANHQFGYVKAETGIAVAPVMRVAAVWRI